MQEKKTFSPTPEDEAANQIPLERASPQQEASSTGQDTGREPDISVHQAAPSLPLQPWPSTAAATHHVEVQGFAEVDLLHQQQQLAAHLLRFEEQTVDGLDGATLAQELQGCEESQVLVGQVIVCQQTFCT